MTGDTLRYSTTPTGWKLDAEARIVAQIAGLFGSDIQVDEFPKDITCVGHRPIGGRRWLVVVKPAGMREMRGRLLDETAYMSLRFDPFAALADIVDDDALRAALQAGPQLQNSHSIDEIEAVARVSRPADLFAADGRAYLTAAYGAFLRGSAAQRAKPYWSALPPRHQPSDYPLCRFAISGKRQHVDEWDTPADTSTSSLPSSAKPTLSRGDSSSSDIQAELSALRSEMAAIAGNVRDNAGGIALLRAQIATISEAAATPLPDSSSVASVVPEDTPPIGQRASPLLVAGALLAMTVSLGAAHFATSRATDARLAATILERVSKKAKEDIERETQAALLAIRTELAEGAKAITAARDVAVGDVDKNLISDIAKLESKAEERRVQAAQHAQNLTTEFEGVVSSAVDQTHATKDEALKEIGSIGPPSTGRIGEAIVLIKRLTTAALACIAAKRIAPHDEKVAECEQFADDRAGERR